MVRDFRGGKDITVFRDVTPCGR